MRRFIQGVNPFGEKGYRKDDAQSYISEYDIYHDHELYDFFSDRNL